MMLWEQLEYNYQVCGGDDPERRLPARESEQVATSEVGTILNKEARRLFEDGGPEQLGLFAKPQL